MASNGPMVLCDNLVKIYKVQDLEVVALQGLDLMVDRGEFMAVIGPSGSGKSTLMNILGGLDRPSAGKAIVDSQDLIKLSSFALTRYRRQKVGFVWQQPSRNLIPYLSVQENVELPMILAGINPGDRKTRVQAALSSLGLRERAKHRPDQLSGGQRQRVAIARATIMQPDIILADEPTGNLDRTSGIEVIQILEDLNNKGMTLIMVTHDPELGKRASRRVRLVDGKISTDTGNS